MWLLSEKKLLQETGKVDALKRILAPTASTSALGLAAAFPQVHRR
jgi:hypothetical protein